MKKNLIFTIGMLFALINVNAQQDSLLTLWEEVNVLKSNNINYITIQELCKLLGRNLLEKASPKEK